MNREQYLTELTELLEENKDILDENILNLFKTIKQSLGKKFKGAGKWLKDAWSGELLDTVAEPSPEFKKDPRLTFRKPRSAKDLANLLKQADPKIQNAIDQAADKIPGKDADILDAAIDSPADRDDKKQDARDPQKDIKTVSMTAKTVAIGNKTIPLYKGKKGVGLKSFLDKNLDISGPAKSLILKFVMLQLKSQGYKVNEAKLEEDFTRVLSEKLAKQERPDQARREAEKEVKRDKNKKKSGNLILPAVPEPGSVQGVNLFKGKKGKGLQSLLTRNKQALGLDPQQITQILKKLKPWFKKKGIQVNEAKLQKILMERLHKK